MKYLISSIFIAGFIPGMVLTLYYFKDDIQASVDEVKYELEQSTITDDPPNTKTYITHHHYSVMMDDFARDLYERHQRGLINVND